VFKPILSDEFDGFLKRLDRVDLTGASRVAVGVSGGPDSMALLWMLKEWAGAQAAIVGVHALIVDHGLREGAAAEAERVRSVVCGWDGVEAFVLRWDGEKPETRLMEEARRARYDLFARHCQAQGIGHLFLGHHGDDQVETVLFRLSKGSGLDGLCGMRAVQDLDDGLVLVRPFLGVEKGRLVVVCEAAGVEYVMDPSNEKEEFARPRMRGARDILEREGLSVKRIDVTARRLQRAQVALDEIANGVFVEALISNGDEGVFLDVNRIVSQPFEVGLRVLIKAIQMLRMEAEYLPRMEKIETLFADVCREEAFRKRTLGGLVFERDDVRRRLILRREV